MKKFLFLLGLLLFAGYSEAQVISSFRYQSGYYKPSTGTYVRPHFKTNSNGTNWDNYSTAGNVNPWTGDAGSRARDYSIEAYRYGSGRTIYIGPNGGQYYYNSAGSKTYVPKRYDAIPSYYGSQVYQYVPPPTIETSSSEDYSEDQSNTYQSDSYEFDIIGMSQSGEDEPLIDDDLSTDDADAGDSGE